MDERERLIVDNTCDIYRILLAMTLHDRCDKSPTWINKCLVHIDKLLGEMIEGRLSIADCRRALIDEIGLKIGADEIYL